MYYCTLIVHVQYENWVWLCCGFLAGSWTWNRWNNCGVSAFNQSSSGACSPRLTLSKQAGHIAVTAFSLKPSHSSSLPGWITGESRLFRIDCHMFIILMLRDRSQSLTLFYYIKSNFAALLGVMIFFWVFFMRWKSILKLQICYGNTIPGFHEISAPLWSRGQDAFLVILGPRDRATSRAIVWRLWKPLHWWPTKNMQQKQQSWQMDAWMWMWKEASCHLEGQVQYTSDFKSK